MTNPTAVRWYRNPVFWQLGFFVVLMASANFSVAISQISLGLALVMMLWRWAKLGEAPPRTGVEVSAAWLALWALAMIPFSADVGQSMVFYRRFFLFTALWVGCSLSTTERNRYWLLGGLLAGAMGISLYGQIVVAREVGGLFTRRFMGTSNAMSSGALLMMVVLVVIGFVAVGGVRRRWRWALAAAAMPVGLALVQTMTRSALLGLACGLGAMVLLVRPRRFLIFLGAGLLLVVLTFGFGERVLPPRLWSRIDPDFLFNGFNTAVRLEMWQGGLEMIKAHPLTGVGDCDLAEIAPHYYGDQDTRYFGHLHSNQIMLGAIWGVPGFILGHLFIIVPLILLIRRWRVLVNIPDVLRINPALAGWILGAIGVWVSFFVAGFTEWYFGDAEPMVLYLAIIGIALGTRAE